jgi:PAS domain S-box-containing protein
VLAPDGTIAYQSPSVQRMLGRRAADLVGTALGDLVHPDDRHDVNVSLTKLVEAAPGATDNVGCRLEHKDGSWRHVESICTNLADDPRVHGLVLNIRDVTEQAALRQSISDLLHNLARRSQGLVDRQLELIDELERNEVDPDRLQELFRMDHLATRMRRNVENLIVLSGVDQHRRWRESVPLRDVVEAAVAEVEEYSRVQVTGIHDLTLAGQAASDVAHLLAELVENATSFSSPATRVEVSGGPTGNGYVLEIEDHGIGMSDAELAEANRRLAEPLAAHVAVSRMMGFHVVGRLAARHGISVQLRHCWFGGVAALVLLPAVLLGSAGEHPATAPPVPAGVMVSPEALLLANATKSGWQPRAHLPLRRQQRRHQTVAGARMPPLGQASRSSRRRGQRPGGPCRTLVRSSSRSPLRGSSDSVHQVMPAWASGSTTARAAAGSSPGVSPPSITSKGSPPARCARTTASSSPRSSACSGTSSPSSPSLRGTTPSKRAARRSGPRWGHTPATQMTA